MKFFDIPDGLYWSQVWSKDGTPEKFTIDFKTNPSKDKTCATLISEEVEGCSKNFFDLFGCEAGEKKAWISLISSQGKILSPKTIIHPLYGHDLRKGFSLSILNLTSTYDCFQIYRCT